MRERSLPVVGRPRPPARGELERRQPREPVAKLKSRVSPQSTTMDSTDPARTAASTAFVAGLEIGYRPNLMTTSGIGASGHLNTLS